MKLKVLLFAAVREAVGKQEVHLEVEDKATISSVSAALQQAYPQLRPLLSKCVFAVNQEYVEQDSVVQLQPRTLYML